MKIVQKGNEPSLYLVLICVLSLRKALNSFENLVQFNRENNENSRMKEKEDDADYDVEAEETDGKSNGSIELSTQRKCRTYLNLRAAVLPSSSS